MIFRFRFFSKREGNEGKLLSTFFYHEACSAKETRPCKETNTMSMERNQVTPQDAQYSQCAFCKKFFSKDLHTEMGLRELDNRLSRAKLQTLEWKDEAGEYELFNEHVRTNWYHVSFKPAGQTEWSRDSVRGIENAVEIIESKYPAFYEWLEA